MFKIIKKAVKDFFHFLNPDRCLFYARSLDRIAEITRYEAAQIVSRPQSDHEKVMALARLIDEIDRIARKDYE